LPSADAKVPVTDDCDQIVVGHRMSITMSCDHNVIDERSANSISRNPPFA
jgi:pyruvate/2-oxoglutarate dehydrogenase complex dihydrolipoamide acyltransferase (E2) component